MNQTQKAGIAAIVVLLGLAFGIVRLGIPYLENKSASAPASLTSEITTELTTKPSGGNSSATLFFAMEAIPSDLFVPLGGNGNYTLVIHPPPNVAGPYIVSAKAPKGLSFRINPPVMTLSSTRTGAPTAADIEVISASNMSAGVYPVFILLQGPQGLANQTFAFHLQKNLLFLQSSPYAPAITLTIKAGESVTWMSRDGPLSDEENAFHKLFFQNMSVQSPGLGQNQAWSYTFAQPGTYPYYDWATYTNGKIVVLP